MIPMNPVITVRVVRRYSASAQQVFDAWLDPKTVGQWLFATPTGEMVQVEIDARVGGSFTLVDRRDGEDVAHTGQYVELDRPHRLVFTFSVPKYSSDQDPVTVEIVSLDAGCELTLTHVMDEKWAEWEAQTREGWTGILEGLATTLAQ